MEADLYGLSKFLGNWNPSSVAIDGKEVLKSAIEVGLVEDAFNEVDRDIVGNDGFLEESSDDEEDTCAEHLLSHDEGTTNLRDEVAGSDDGTCHQLREEGDIESIVEQSIEWLDVAAIDIDGVTEGLEGEEGDANGQENVAWLPYDTLQITACDA